MMDILVDDIDSYEQLMFQDRLHWFGKRLTCSCYVAYVKFSHNVTFYEKIQISLSSTKLSYCRSIIVNLIQTFLRTCGEILIVSSQKVDEKQVENWVTCACFQLKVSNNLFC
jgi:hypothetical protein